MAVAEPDVVAGPQGDSGRAPRVQGPGGGGWGAGPASEQAAQDAKYRIGALRASFKRCFERALNTNPELNGRFFFDVTQLPNGGVSVKVSDRSTPELRGTELETCLMSAIQRTRLDDPKHPITKPISFTLPVTITSQ